MINFNFDFYEIIIWVATGIFCIFANFMRKFPIRKRGGLGQPLPNPLAVVLPIIFFTYFAALRKNVGDTYYYVLSFEEYIDSNIEVNGEMFFTEMFNFFQAIIRKMTSDGQWLIAFSAFCSIPIPLVILYKYSYPFDLSLFMFIAYGYLGGMMNGMRQYMAAAIVLCGTRYLFSLKRGSFIKYAVIIMLAWSMHNSALLMIPFYFVARRKSWQLSSYVILIGSVIITVAFDTILPSFLGAVEQTSYSTYSQDGWFTNGVEGGSSLNRAIAAFVPLVVAYFNRNGLKRLGHVGDVLSNIALLNLCICIVATYNWIFVRVAIYLMIYFIIFSVWVVYCAVEPRNRSTYTVGLIVCFFMYSRYLGYQISGYESEYFFPGKKLFR